MIDITSNQDQDQKISMGKRLNIVNIYLTKNMIGDI